MIKVGVLGASGRMGSAVCDAVGAEDDLELVAKVGSGDALETLTGAGAEVAVDFTTPDAVMANIEFLTSNGIHAVVGTTGIDDDALGRIREMATASNVFIAPNFALGAVLMMSFAAKAAPHFERAEIVERHHERKLDAPSGTSLRTAELMNAARGEAWNSSPEDDEAARGLDSGGIRIHSIRTPGSVAHQEVVFGGVGETLTIRHDSLDRSSFMPGVILAVKKVASLERVTVGLEHLLGI